VYSAWKYTVSNCFPRSSHFQCSFITNTNKCAADKMAVTSFRLWSHSIYSYVPFPVLPIIVGSLRDLFVEDCTPQILDIGLWWIGSERRCNELKYHSYVSPTNPMDEITYSGANIRLDCKSVSCLYLWQKRFLPCSQKPATRPILERDESNTHLHIKFLSKIP
jgi:hypothetical protein